MGVVDDHPFSPPKPQLILNLIDSYPSVVPPLLNQSLKKGFVLPPPPRRNIVTRELLGLDTNHLTHRYPGKRDIDDDLDCSRIDTMDTSSTTHSTTWSYDKMASVPKMAEAFRAFAWRALCQESVMFLEEVSK